jgi:hypothetical protein
MNPSTIKGILYSFVTGSMIFFITTKLIAGIQMSGQFMHWIMAYAVFVAANALVPHLLRFFTLPGNFFAYWIMSALMSFIAIYVMSLILPGVLVVSTVIDPVGLGIISINPYTLSPIFTMVAGGVVAGLMTASIYTLKDD